MKDEDAWKSFYRMLEAARMGPADGTVPVAAILMPVATGRRPSPSRLVVRSWSIWPGAIGEWFSGLSMGKEGA